MQALASQKERSRVADLRGRLDGLEARRSSLLDEGARLDEKISRNEERLSHLDLLLKVQKSKLYGGSITSSKELQSLEQEIASATQEKADLEDVLLSAMESREAGEKSLHRMASDLQAVSVDLGEALEDEQERQELLGRRHGDFLRARAAVLAELSQDAVERYGRLRISQGSPLAKVKGGNCGGCHMSVPDSHWRGVKQGQLLNCPSCGRFLHE